MFFQQGALNVPQIPRFSSCFHFQFSKQTNQKQWYLQCFDKTTSKKNRCFGTIFRIFSARARQVKNQSFFAAFLLPLIRTQEGVKSPKIAKLHVNLTFYLSQSLLQSCNTKNYRRRSGASKCCKLRCFMNVPCILPAKKGTPPPQLKLTALVPPERHALLHLRCGRICHQSSSFLTNHHLLLLSPFVINHELWSIIIYHHLSSFIIIYHQSLFIII